MIKTKLHPRRKAREAVLQALYALEIGHESHEKVLEDILNRQSYSKDSKSFIINLMRESLDHREWCEEQISKRLNNWEFGRVALLDRLVLISAISEIFFIDDVPPKVSISEAIEIAKRYSTEESPGFVNGILDNIYKTMIQEKTAE
ncbi:MAG: transcription antitermination factor NusB [Candidatus Neomarinimicrobiota bacterium]